jgi:hypothetical protein
LGDHRCTASSLARIATRRKRDALNMPWKSCYFEYGQNSDTFLSESGFMSFPGVVPRWDVESGDIYGNSPGMEALGDAKQLQHEQFRKGRAIDFATLPPLQAPVGMKAQDVVQLPGGVSFANQTRPARDQVAVGCPHGSQRADG